MAGTRSALTGKTIEGIGRAAAFLAPQRRNAVHTRVPDTTLVSPDGYSLDKLPDSPRCHECSWDLFRDLPEQRGALSRFQQYFKTHKPRFLAAWGKNDRSFCPPVLKASNATSPRRRPILRYRHFALEHTPLRSQPQSGVSFEMSTPSAAHPRTPPRRRQSLFDQYLS